MSVPPSLITSAPMRDAISFCEATIPYLARSGTEPAPTAVEISAPTETTRTNRFIFSPLLNAFQLPTPAAEHNGAEDREQRERDRNRPERALRADVQRPREHVRQRDLEQPEAQQIEQRRRQRVACAVERLRQHHAVRVEEESTAHDAEAANRVGRDRRIACEPRNQLW